MISDIIAICKLDVTFITTYYVSCICLKVWNSLLNVLLICSIHFVFASLLPPRFKLYIAITPLEERTGNESLIMGQWFGEGPPSAIYELGAGQQSAICMILGD